MAENSLIVTLDILVLGCLGVSIVYMFFLTKGIKKIRESRGEFKQVLKELNQTIDRAEKAVNGMQATADRSGKELQKQIEAAKNLADELQFINQAGDNVAKRLEKLTVSENKKAAPASDTKTAKGASKAERELAVALDKHKKKQG